MAESPRTTSSGRAVVRRPCCRTRRRDAVSSGARALQWLPAVAYVAAIAGMMPAVPATVGGLRSSELGSVALGLLPLAGLLSVATVAFVSLRRRPPAPVRVVSVTVI